MSRLNRRRFIFHSAHRTVGLTATLAALPHSEVVAEFLEVEDAPKPPPKTLRLCLVSGSEEYRSDESLTWLADYLQENFGIVSDKAFARGLKDLPGLEALDRCDCMVLFTRRLEIDGEPLERIRRYFAQGRPAVGIRTASHAFQNWLALDKEVFGGDYGNHYGRDLLPRIELAPSGRDHPIVRGFEPYVSPGSLYRNANLADDVTVLLTGTIPGHTEPVAWTRNYKGGRVFYTSLGHPDDFRHRSFVRLITSAIFWVCKHAIPDVVGRTGL
ncbi:MAG: ThuA domain-containing protein [Thermogutta sp.]